MAWRIPTPDGRMRHHQSDLIVLAQTVLGEAEGEDWCGKHAVAWVIRNRVDTAGWPNNYKGVIFQPYQFSCWNEGSPRIKVMESPKAHVEQHVWHECFQAAALAMWNTIPDPTKGANHYLNVEETRRIRHGSLPSWYDEDKVTLKLGKHTFLKL